MLEPDGRVVLLEQLRPPVGYHVHAAVATTFTLSLTAALVPPLAFAAAGTSTSDPLATLSSVRACADVVDIFCQPGQIAVPATASDLMAFLEPMVHPVVPPKGFLFHPKIWLLHYVHDDTGEERYRLLCTSRNLVESDAWDLAVTLDGVRGDEPLAANDALAGLIRWLPDNTISPLPEPRAQRVKRLADDVAFIRWEIPEGVSDVTTHAWGLAGTPVTADFSGSSHLVVAPFMDAAGLEHVASSKRVSVISRAETIDALDEEARCSIMDAGSIFVLDAAAVAAESASTDVEAPDAFEREGLHAKLVILERGRRAHVFIGSPNATSAAYHGNVEFALELVGTKTRVGIDAVLGEDSPLSTYLQPYFPTQMIAVPDDPLLELKRALRNAANIPFHLRVHDTGGIYRLDLAGERALKLPEDAVATMSLLTRQGVSGRLTSGRVPACEFTGVPKADITPFIVLTLTQGGETLGTVVHARLHGDPPGRLDEILTRQIDTPQKFVRFLLLLLGFGNGTGTWITALETDGRSSTQPGAADSGAAWSGLLEELVQALATNPEAINKAADLIGSLRRTDAGRAVLPKGFDALWNNILAARDKIAQES